jgi:hypothetical protein
MLLVFTIIMVPIRCVPFPLSLSFSLSLSLSRAHSPDGYLYDKEAILECLLHQKRESEWFFVCVWWERGWIAMLYRLYSSSLQMPVR